MEGSYIKPDSETAGQEKEEKIHFLKNPLPEPPRHTHIRMEFDLTDNESGDDFDIEVSDDDDFDI